MAQWLGLSALTARGPGSIPGWGTKILQATQWHSPSKKNIYIHTHTHTHTHTHIYTALGSDKCYRANQSRYGGQLVSKDYPAILNRVIRERSLKMHYLPTSSSSNQLIS